MSAQPKATAGRPKDLEKRAAILEAAKALFPARGYDGVSMDAIAQQAGVSKLTVYNHFKDKDSLFLAAVVECCEEQLPHRVFEWSESMPVRDALLAIARGFQALVMSAEAIGLFRIMAAQAGQNPRLAELFFEAGPRRTLAELDSFLSLAHARGVLHVPEPLRAAEHFFGLLKGVRHMRVLLGLMPQPSVEENERHGQAVVDLFLRAYTPTS